MIYLPYPWFKTAWAEMRDRAARLPHAMLVCGPRDIGLDAFAAFHAQSLLCEVPAAAGEPCGQCAACRWFGEHNHPDFRAVLPEALQPDSPVGEVEEGGAVAEEAGSAKAKRAPSKVIKIGQIRELDSFFNVGTHRGGRRVVMLYPADTITVEAANRLLKTLEEPPADTFFVLVSSRPSEVLPTIRSRCARFDVPRPDAAVAATWLREQGVANPEVALAESGGAPLAAVVEDADAGIRETLLAALAAGIGDAVGLADRCEKAGADKLCLWLSRWVSDIVLCGATGDVRYHPAYRPVISRLAQTGRTREFIEFFRRLLRLRGVAEHPLNARLFAEDLLIDYARLTAPAR